MINNKISSPLGAFCVLERGKFAGDFYYSLVNTDKLGK